MAENCFGAKNAQNQLFTSISKPQFSCELTWFTIVDLIVQETAHKYFGANYAQNQLVTSTVLFFKWIVLFRDGVYINQSTFCDKMENDCDNIWTLSLDQHRQSKCFQDQFDCVELRNENHIAIFPLLTNVGLIENDIICGLIFNTQNVDSL